jgi:hypothetical protein
MKEKEDNMKEDFRKVYWVFMAQIILLFISKE